MQKWTILWRYFLFHTHSYVEVLRFIFAIRLAHPANGERCTHVVQMLCSCIEEIEVKIIFIYSALRQHFEILKYLRIETEMCNEESLRNRNHFTCRESNSF